MAKTTKKDIDEMFGVNTNARFSSEPGKITWLSEPPKPVEEEEPTKKKTKKAKK